MENLKNHLAGLESQLNLTKHDAEPEPYILTKEEELAVIDREIERAKEHMAWKMKDKGVHPEDAKLKLSQIDWDSQVNKEEILFKANSNKNYQVWQDQQREKEKNERDEKIKELKEIWSAKTVLKLIRWTSLNKFGKQLIEDEHTMPLIKALCFFISQDSRFETELNYSLKKGLWIRGIAGLGKTHTISCASQNELSPISIFSLIEISQAIKEDGEFQIPQRANGKIYLDDVGSEEPSINHYGTNVNWFKDFIETFYLRSQQYNRLIVSTNFNFKDIEQKYGFRVRSRIRDMFNVIDVTGKDLRG